MNQLMKPLDMMSSKRIAEKTGKEHKHVIRDIRVMIDELKKDGPNLSHEFLVKLLSKKVDLLEY